MTTQETFKQFRDDIKAWVTNNLNAIGKFSGKASDITLDPIDGSDSTNAQEEFERLNSDLTSLRSHVGMIIHTTTLDTMEKVIAVYGGTTWEKIEGRFLLGQSADYEIGSTGGEAKHTLTFNEMPSHEHYVGGAKATAPDGIDLKAWTAASVADSSSSGGRYYPIGVTLAGGSQPHNNMPPYKTVYIWERTS